MGEVGADERDERDEESSWVVDVLGAGDEDIGDTGRLLDLRHTGLGGNFVLLV